MEPHSTEFRQGLKTKTRTRQSKFSEIGNMAMTQNKNQGLQLMKSLDLYDKQRAKAARSIEFAQRSFKDNIKSLNSKLNDGQFSDARFRSFQGDRRRQSSPSPLSVTGSLDLNKGKRLEERGLVEMPLRGSGARSNTLNINHRLSIHRHSLPEYEHSSFDSFKSLKSKKESSLLKPDNMNISSKNLLKTTSCSNLQEPLGQPKHDINDSKLVSFSLPKIDSLEHVKTPNNVSLPVLPSIKTSDFDRLHDVSPDSTASGSS